MEEVVFPSFLDIIPPSKSYQKPAKKNTNIVKKTNALRNNNSSVEKREPLTTKNAMKLLLEGKLKAIVCRYCLNVAPSLSELDQIMHVAGPRTTYKVTIKDMIASFHPVKIADDHNLPDKICDKCLNLTLSAYLFTQQCERSERAIRNCFIDMYEKIEKLDPLERPRKRGRQKVHLNHNILNTEHEKVIDYAEPVINIVNLGAETMPDEPEMTELECKRCWQVLPNIDSLVNHEKTHPTTMWFHCRLCGKSFPKRNQFRIHYHRVHVLGKEHRASIAEDFVCKECGHATDSYKQHLQHIEKHKFKVIMKHLVVKKMDRLCAICLDESAGMVDLDTIICMHGGHPELMGDKILQRILASTLPDMDNLNNYLGTKICEKCLNNAITSYVFMNQFIFARERLDICVSHTLKSIANINPLHNIFVHIPDTTILPLQEDFDETLLLNENDYVDESKLKVDVLEDEFREQSDSESEDEVKLEEKPIIKTEDNSDTETEDIDDDDIENPAKNATKTYTRKKLVNGLQRNNYADICSEFLTFKKKPKRRCTYTCPLCSKHFISDYFLKRHILKHVNRKVQCNTCKSTFKSKFCLYEHTKMIHLLKTAKYRSCKVCDRAFLKEERLKSHVKRHRSVSCQLCGKTYFDQKHFNLHMQRHEPKLVLLSRSKLQTCSFCEKECSNDNQLSVHVNKVHFAIKPYSCDMCDRQFYTQNNLKCHKRVHSMPSKEVCALCNKCFKTRKRLVMHIRKHIGAKPFVCQMCGQSFYSQAQARTHMKVYHGGRYCCGICKTAHATKFGLRDHMNKEHSFI